MVTTIHHVAWAVNFRLSVSSFSSNLASVQNLINFALSSPHKDPPNLIFCSSVASIANHPAGKVITESISSNINDCGPLGYSRSKWIAESICNGANQQTRLKGRIAVMRVGQLSGATTTGNWNMSEAYPMLLSQVTLTNCLPDLEDVPLTWLPVDVAARAFLEVAETMKKGTSNGMRVYHVVNTDTSTKWKDLLVWVEKIHANVEAMPPAAFVEKLQELQKAGSEHPAMRLIPHWKETYGEVKETNRERKQEQSSEQKQVLTFEMENTYAVAPVLQEPRPVDEAYFGKIWKWIQEQEQAREH
jgi:thioester reductase-like protein